MRLDVNTPKGQITVSQEIEQLAILKNSTPDFEFIHTPKDRPADVDGFIVKDHSVVGMFLSSCRTSTRDQMRKWGDTWLLTFDKIQKAIPLAKQLCVPVYGCIYLVPDRMVLTLTLVSAKGEVMPNIRLERTQTQATVNGGQVVRTNAYISLETATEHQ